MSRREDEIVELLKKLAAMDPADRGFVQGMLYVVSAPSAQRAAWYRTVVDVARARGFTAVAGYEVEPYLAMSPLNVAHILIARGDALLFDVSNITSGIGYQLGFAFAIGNVSQDVIVLKDADDATARQMLCPYEVVPYADARFEDVLDKELDRLLKVRPYLQGTPQRPERSKTTARR